jgi:membrane-associated phospholipid phosphatase
MTKNILQTFTFFGTPPFYFGLTIVVFFFSPLTSLFILITVGVTELICAIIKLITRKSRPIPREKEETLYQKYDASTFPSAHTGRIASNMAMIYLANPAIYILIIGVLLTVLVAWSRVALKQHYVSDVVAGAVTGVTFTYLVFKWLF